MKETATYTFIMNFRGGTYCSQLKAFDIEQALNKWTNKIKKDSAEIKYLTLDKLTKLKAEIGNGERPTKLKGLKNIWFSFFLLTNKDEIYLHIIKTDTEPSR
jgi:hypothetical protein